MYFVSLVVVAPPFILSIPKAKESKVVSLRPVLQSEFQYSQIHRETLSEKENQMVLMFILF